MVSSRLTVLSAPQISSACGASTPATRQNPISVSDLRSPVPNSLVSRCLVVQKGSDPAPEDAHQDFNYTNVQVSIDEDYACTVYTSCKQTSFIAAAGVSSSVGFLNFLGFNGAEYSLSYINFTTNNTD